MYRPPLFHDRKKRAASDDADAAGLRRAIYEVNQKVDGSAKVTYSKTAKVQAGDKRGRLLNVII